MNKLSFRAGLFFLFFGALSYTAQAQIDDEFDVEIGEESRGNHGGVGAFGYDLSRKASFVNLNGFITTEFHRPQNGTAIFDQHYFNLIVSTEITENISAEAQLEYEHGGDELDFRYGFFDYKVSDALVFRVGKFLTPAGEFNEYLYPDYVNKTVNRAYVNREIAPSAWSETGLQVRGRVGLGRDNLTLFYSAFVSNGLHGSSDAGIRSLRSNNRDRNDNKAFGGNVGVEVGKHLTLSANGYTGTYDDVDSLNLAIYGLSATYQKNDLTIWGELQAANQDYYSGFFPLAIDTRNKIGAYGLVAYRVWKGLEPMLRFDFINLDGDMEDNRTRITGGLNYYFTDNAVLKVNYDAVQNGAGTDENDKFSVQLALGF